MAVIVGGDEVVTTTPKGRNKKVIRPPPPVYGNFRESKVCLVLMNALVYTSAVY